MRWACETMLVRLGLITIPFWPRGFLLLMARLAGSGGYYLARQSRKIALANLDLAFQDSLSLYEKRRLARQAFEIMTRTVLDMIWFCRKTEKRLSRYLAFDQQVKNYVYTAPMIGLTAHFGSWELLGRGLVARGYPIAAVAAPLINPGIERIFQHYRTLSGVTIIPQAGAVRGLLRALKQKQHIALVTDQNVKPVDGGVFVDFFGLPVPITTAPAILADRTGAPIIMMFCLAKPDGTYCIYALPPLNPETFTGANRIHDLTQAIANLFQQEIRKHPEQWLWMYKRWKHIPSGAAAAYPFYAKPLE